ncbi:DUF916 and DUF3324 domain-containing protein [Enterococcus sp. DIV0242_7C1]|uniref:DUF3324 domain-containing protein n=1 Tax=Candidatus Enterococcus dunnyi TaxID=1834192 RepID=A0A200JE89_9ENTE|nr:MULTISPECIES: DUF916 and DUF3324 domain-containing protein [unclassified Enterococcus]MBO0470470.1 DUF916 and DUF3324 domain-containing protein [Enterococcus sp. DIV0242_7C1]OUZ34877.1 hypothetical protein A5889_000352 [Enterococcus sp. 9D6_DIV0238]
MKTHKSFTLQYISLVFSIIVGFIFLGQAVSVSADEENSAGATGFTYSIIFPDNQIDKELGYYKLKMTPGQQQQLSIMLSNPSAEKVTIDVQVNGAKTNQNGVIEYGESAIKNDPSLKFNFIDLVEGPKSVELAPGETKSLDLTIKMPETEYDGVVAGGIQLMRAGQDATTNSGGSKIINQYAYVIGVLLQENDTVIHPDLSLNSVKAGQNNYRNAIFINYSNIKAAYLNDMTAEVQITEKGKETVLYERKQTAMRMAPNSFIDFPVSMNGERMIPGDYEADILIASGDKKWAWKQAFKITDEDANKFNERDVGLVQEKSLDWKLILLLVAAFLVGIFLLFLVVHFFRKSKNKKNATNKKTRKQKKHPSGKISNKQKKTNY